IAKRIEAGREAMIAGLCESPLTFQAIIIWRDELAQGKVLLRDIIDLEATYAGPEAKQAPAAPETEQELAAADDGMMAPPEPAERAPRAARPLGPARRRARRGRRGYGECAFARFHGSGAEAESGRDLRPRRRRLQAAPQASGPERRIQAQERLALAEPRAPLQEIARRAGHAREVALA